MYIISIHILARFRFWREWDSCDRLNQMQLISSQSLSLIIDGGRLYRDVYHKKPGAFFSASQLFMFNDHRNSCNVSNMILAKEWNRCVMSRILEKILHWQIFEAPRFEPTTFQLAALLLTTGDRIRLPSLFTYIWAQTSCQKPVLYISRSWIAKTGWAAQGCKENFLAFSCTQAFMILLCQNFIS